MENRKQQNLPQKYFETKMKHLNEAKNSVSTSSALQQTINYRRNSINYETTFERRKKEFFDFSFLFAQICVYGIIFGILIILIWQLPFSTKFRNTVDLIIIQQNELECSKTCRINLVESIVQNLSFPKEYSQQPALSTFIVWNKLINNAKHSILIAAYKSSLRGKHVLGELNSNNISLQGEQIFETIINNGKEIQIKMVENAVSKDKGDNEDGISLAKRNVINRRVLNLKQIYNTGIMHSKMIISDNKHFYLGSANLDWRSLTQKMELGVLVEDCPCLGRDLSKIFEIYWRTSEKKNANDVQKIIQQMPPALYNSQRPLRILDEENNKLAVHLSSSPRSMNNLKRSWDLNDIVEAIKNSKKEIFIHVMDYFPMFLYTQKGKYWPPIDNAIREAIIRGVKIKIISTALHFPNKGLGFLKSLQVLGERQGESSVTVKIFKVPVNSFTNQPLVLQRDRRTHKKFMLTDDTLIIGTSNWSGDYFEDLGTGIAIILKQIEENGRKPLIFKQIKNLFERDWNSKYTHLLDKYIDNCLNKKNNNNNNDDICEKEKDPKLLNNLNKTIINLNNNLRE